jgi:arginyl-tRNA synthetase
MVPMLKVALVSIIQEGIGQVLKEAGVTYTGTIPVEHPADPTHGDYATAVAFALHKMGKKSDHPPAAIAKQLAAAINDILASTKVTLDGKKVLAANIVDRAVATGPFVNLWLSRAHLTQLAQTVAREGTHYGVRKNKSPQTIVVEYSSPNIGKPFGIGHLRSTVNGEAIANLLETQGHRVVRINYPGDWGTQFGKLIVAYKKWGDAEAFEEDPIPELQRVYVKFHEEAKKDESLEEQGREWFKKLETGDKEALDIWREFRQHSLEAFQEVWDLLEVKFDETSGESVYQEKLQPTLELLKKHKLLKESQGAMIIDLEDQNLPPVLMQKKDEASLYATRELAAAIDRFARYKFDRMLYEVGIEQELHFKQLFAVVGKLKLPFAERLEHVKHGLYALGGKKMSTRAGRTAGMDAILKEAIARAEKIITEKNPELQNRATVARQVGVGAVKYHDLSQSRTKNIEFDFDRMLSLDGNSAPYLQYTHARIHSLLRKGKVLATAAATLTVDPKSFTEVEEKALLSRLTRYSEVLEQAAQKRLPHVLATELYELAAAFNLFYGKLPVLKASEPHKSNRLLLAAAVGTLLRNGLALLGIRAPEEM